LAAQHPEAGTIFFAAFILMAESADVLTTDEQL